MELPDKKLPEVSKEEFYSTCKSLPEVCLTSTY